MSIKVITDSTSYIPKEIQEDLDLSIVSLNIIVKGTSERELDVNLDQFYSHLKELNEIPTSSQPTPDEMLETFESLVRNGHDIFGVFLSSEMSGTFSNAHMIRDLVLEKYPTANIQLFDSMTNCMQMGYIAIEAAKAAKAGASMDEVIEVATQVKEHSRFLFTPETLDYLKKGGRIGGASALLGNIFQIKPILTIEDGKTTVYTKVRTKKKAIQTFIDKFKEDLTSRELGGVIVHHINNEEDGFLLAQKLEEELKQPVGLQSIGPVIGCHVGPGSIGIAYYTK